MEKHMKKLLEEILWKYEFDRKHFWIHNGSREEIEELAFSLKERISKDFCGEAKIIEILSYHDIEKISNFFERSERDDYLNNKYLICCDHLSNIIGHRTIYKDIDKFFYKVNVRYGLVIK